MCIFQKVTIITGSINPKELEAAAARRRSHMRYREDKPDYQISRDYEHSADCLAQQMWAEELRQQWRAKYPGYCRTCEGEGGKEYPSSLYEQPPDFEPCKDCVEQHLCGRCGAEGFNTWQPCQQCGWLFDDGIPYAISCIGCHDTWPPCEPDPFLPESLPPGDYEVAEHLRATRLVNMREAEFVD